VIIRRIFETPGAPGEGPLSATAEGAHVVLRLHREGEWRGTEAFRFRSTLELLQFAQAALAALSPTDAEPPDDDGRFAA